MAGRVVVVGLGPAGVDHLLPAARAALERLDVRYVRTRRHPTVVQLEADGITFESFDHLYDVATDLDAAYRAMVATLVDGAARYGEVAYAVPGSPVMAERTVALLHEVSGRSELA
ncbi:MAG TPA: SAM-dependent methyltransferase, partial [Acidimicrobiia bacterium]